MIDVSAVLLMNPKFPVNVGNALRSCALLGVQHLFWTGERVPSPDDWPEGTRLPREERMRCYKRTRMTHLATLRPIDHIRMAHEYEGVEPVCIEIVPGAVPIDVFPHPRRALYVFGPEDGDIPKGIRHACHHFVTIPNAIDPMDIDGRTPYNLSVALSMVLFHRLLVQREETRQLMIRNVLKAG